MDETTSSLVAGVERAVDFIPKANDGEIHALVRTLKAALERNDTRVMRDIAGQIVEHATNRYAAVVEQADRLAQHLESR